MWDVRGYLYTEITLMELPIIGQATPVKIAYKSPNVPAAATAYERGFDAKPFFLRGGGSLQIVPAMTTG